MKGNRLFVHVTEADAQDIFLPAQLKVRKAVTFADRSPVKFSKTKEGITLHLDRIPDEIDYVVELELK